MADHQHGVWSAAWFRAAARLSAVGTITGALAAAVFLLLLTVLAGDSPLGAAGFLFIAVAIGAGSGLLVALVCAATGLVLAARAPRRRSAVTGLLLLWPLVLTALVIRGMGSNAHFGAREIATLSVVQFGLILISILGTYRWVTAPLASTLPGDCSRTSA